MILETSSALMSIVSHLLAGPTPARSRSGRRRCALSLCPWLRPCRERLFHLLQLPRHAAVVDRAADPGDGASDDRRIDAALELNLAPGRIRQPLLTGRAAV